jgi:hypothetical protein
MQRRIVGFHQDTERDWVAELECGHGQHVRHNPPWEVRPWVLTEATRSSRLGSTLNCRLCDIPPLSLSEPEPEGQFEDRQAPSGLSPSAARAYLDARLQGLCHEGALEVARAVGEAQLDW